MNQTPEYFVDPKTIEEMSRLHLQDELFTFKIQGGLLSERPNFQGIRRVLDIACGPGGWVLNVAQAHPDIQATGIDISEPMMQFARSKAFQTSTKNVTFERVDATRYPLPYADGSFDLVNARLIYAFMVRDLWPKLIEECYRLLKPGGFLRVGQEDGHLITNSWGMAEYHRVGCGALYKAGKGFYVDNLGIIPRLPVWFREAGFSNIKQQQVIYDISYGTEGYRVGYEDYKVLFKTMQPFVVRYGSVTKEEIEAIYQQAIQEMMSPSYTAYWHIATVFGEKS